MVRGYEDRGISGGAGPDESPIMGDSYYATRGVWAQGTSSLGPNVIQDDLAVLSANNFGYRAR